MSIFKTHNVAIIASRHVEVLVEEASKMMDAGWILMGGLAVGEHEKFLTMKHLSPAPTGEYVPFQEHFFPVGLLPLPTGPLEPSSPPTHYPGMGEGEIAPPSPSQEATEASPSPTSTQPKAKRGRPPRPPTSTTRKVQKEKNNAH
jgi:hypothetical protein